jgi:hypothetical protein
VHVVMVRVQRQNVVCNRAEPVTIQRKGKGAGEVL